MKNFEEQGRTIRKDNRVANKWRYSEVATYVAIKIQHDLCIY